jgi:hypothetical protein
MDASTSFTAFGAASNPDPSRTDEQFIATQIAASDPFSPWAMPFWQDDLRLRRRVLLASARLDWPLAESISRSSPDAYRLDETALLSLIGELDPGSPPQFTIEAAATTLNAVDRFTCSGTWEEQRPSRTVRALQGSVERAVENVAPSVSKPPTMLAVAVCLTVRGEDILKGSGAATDRLQERLPPATETDVALGVRERTVTDARDLLGYGAVRGETSEPRWDEDERVARLQFERDLALGEPTGDGTRNRMRRTAAIAHGLRLLNALPRAHASSITGWATRVAAIARPGVSSREAIDP